MTNQKWQIRCLKCGQSRDVEAAGITRIGWGRKYTIGWCSRCRWLRCAVIERMPERGFDVVTPQQPVGHDRQDRHD